MFNSEKTAPVETEFESRLSKWQDAISNPKRGGPPDESPIFDRKWRMLFLILTNGFLMLAQILKEKR